MFKSEDSSDGFTNEMIIANIESIASSLGIALHSLAKADIAAIQSELAEKLKNERDAEKIVEIARKITIGKNSAREIKKLVGKYEGQFHEDVTNVPFHVQNPHFSKKTEIARARIPQTRHPSHKKWNLETIFRGPKSTRNK